MSTSATRTAVLAAKISELTAALETYHHDNQVPPVNFDESNWSEHTYSQEMGRIRMELIDACQEMQDLVLGPRRMVQTTEESLGNFLGVVITFDIPKHVPKEGSISYAKLADAVGVSEIALKRVLRNAISRRVFREQERGFVSHSAASRLIAEDSSMYGYIRTSLQIVKPAMDKQAAAMKKWPHPEGASETAFSLADEHGRSFWACLAQSPETSGDFAQAMTQFAQGEGMSFSHLVDNYPWASLAPGTIVDVGGSTGDAAFAIAEKFPKLNIIVQDLAQTIALAREKAGVSVTFKVHDYFEEQPVKGADVYMYRWIFHDVPQSAGVKMLKALIPALKKGSRILVMDAVMPESGSLCNWEERRLRGFDCGMMALFNGSERELDVWKDLFASADARFQWCGVKQPKGSKLALIEAVWDP